MFPDLTCDDVFRLETKRLWLRWPRATDAAAIAEFAAKADVAQMTAEIPHPYPPREAERFIFKARAENAAGLALHLVLTHKAAARAVIGVASAHAGENQSVEIGYAMAPQVWGKGFATEAVRGLIDLIFNVTPALRTVASSRVANTASRRVLEKSGLKYVGEGLESLPARGGHFPCEHFELDRASWHRGCASRRMPPMVQQRRDGAEIGAAAAKALAEPEEAVPQC
jgi:RimJ/RimL family protein N-acetyltransferase